MADYLVRALAFDGLIRAQAIRSTGLVGEAQRRHNTWPVVSAALGRTMTAATMLGAQLKGEDRVTVTVEGGGPIGAIIVDADAHGKTRGYVTNPQVHFDLNQQGKLDVRSGVGTEGYLSVIKDLGMRENFTGRVPLVSGEIGEDFTYYLTHSEQIPSAVGVGVLVNPDNSIKASGGFMIQVLPGAPEEAVAKLEEALSGLRPVSKMIADGLSPEAILAEIFGKENLKVLDHTPVAFQCNCSKQKISTAIMGLGAEEVKAMIEEDHGAEVNCHFCRETYQLTEDDLREIHDKITG